MTRKIKKYGWIPDLPDQRDHRYAAPPPVLHSCPKKSTCVPGAHLFSTRAPRPKRHGPTSSPNSPPVRRRNAMTRRWSIRP